MQSPGLLSILFKAFTRNLVPSITIYFDVSPHSCLVHVSHLMLLSDISWLVKLGISSLEYSTNNLFSFQYFMEISFILLYTFTKIYFPFIHFIGCNPPGSHNHLIFPIRKYIFSSLLIFLILNVRKDSSRQFSWAHHSSTNNNIFSLEQAFPLFQITVSNSSFRNEMLLCITLHMVSFFPNSSLKTLDSDILSLIFSISLDTDLPVQK